MNNISFDYSRQRQHASFPLNSTDCKAVTHPCKKKICSLCYRQRNSCAEILREEVREVILAEDTFPDPYIHLPSTAPVCTLGDFCWVGGDDGGGDGTGAFTRILAHNKYLNQGDHPLRQDTTNAGRVV